MNNIFLVHCWEGTINDGWYPWLKERLEQNLNNIVHMENMPNTNNPKINEWISKLDEQVKEIDENTYFIGHSIGCQTILRYLEKKNIKKIGGILLIAPWLELLPAALEDDDSKEIAKPWLNININFNKIKEITNNIICVFSDNDYWVSLEQKNSFEKLLDSKTIVLHGKGHISEADGVFESSDILDAINTILKKDS